jgi:hypothetical protein
VLQATAEAHDEVQQATDGVLQKQPTERMKTKERYKRHYKPEEELQATDGANNGYKPTEATVHFKKRHGNRKTITEPS